MAQPLCIALTACLQVQRNVPQPHSLTLCCIIYSPLPKCRACALNPSCLHTPQAKAFYSWIDWVAWRNRMRVIMDRTAKRMLNSRLAKAWDAWRAAYLDSKMDFHLSKKEELAVSNALLVFRGVPPRGGCREVLCPQGCLFMLTVHANHRCSAWL